MTKEELRVHCEKQVKMCEEWANGNARQPSGKIYEEHKLILELLKENEDFQNYLDKANHTNSELIQIIERHKMQQPSDDCVSRKAVLETIEDCSSDGLKGIFCSYVDGERFKEYIERMPSVTVKHGNCMDCKYNKSVHSHIICYTDTYCECGHRNEMRVAETFCCADFKKRANENENK